jgi:micrococcal nuclease
MQLSWTTALWIFGLAGLGSVPACLDSAPADETSSGGESTGSPCGPAVALVEYVVDGDTVELEGGERVRYLMVDTPESTNGADDCYGMEAAIYNRDLVEGREVTLSYDSECRDTFGRLLAYVEVDGVEVNTRLVEFGFACVLHIPPNGADRLQEFMNFQAIAQSESRGMWGACASPCE